MLSRHTYTHTHTHTHIYIYIYIKSDRQTETNKVLVGSTLTKLGEIFIYGQLYYFSRKNLGEA